MTETTIDAVVARFRPAHRERVRALIGNDEELASYYGGLIPEPQRFVVPHELTRKCRTYKSCGNTELRLEESFAYEAVEGALSEDGEQLYRRVQRYTYRRQSNDDIFFSGNLVQILAFLNDPWYFPVDTDADADRRQQAE